MIGSTGADKGLRNFAEKTPYVGGAIGLVRGVTSLASVPVRTVNTASDAVAGALPFEVTSGVANEGAAAFGESVDVGVYVANNKAAVAGAIKDSVIDTSSRAFLDGDQGAASDFTSGITQAVVAGPTIAGGVTSMVTRVKPSIAGRFQAIGRGVATVRDRVSQAFRFAEAPDGSVGAKFNDVDSEAGIGQIEHPLAQPSRHGDFYGPWREGAGRQF